MSNEPREAAWATDPEAGRVIITFRRGTHFRTLGTLAKPHLEAALRAVRHRHGQVSGELSTRRKLCHRVIFIVLVKPSAPSKVVIIGRVPVFVWLWKQPCAVLPIWSDGQVQLFRDAAT